MKNNRFNSVLSSAILSSAIAMGLFASTATAQAQSSNYMSANISFPFQAGSTRMPAGWYQVTLLTDHLVRLQSQGPGKQASVMFTVNPSQDGKIQTNARLVFHRYGNKYFLREIWEADSKEGVQCAPTRDEKEILRAQNQSGGADAIGGQCRAEAVTDSRSTANGRRYPRCANQRTAAKQSPRISHQGWAPLSLSSFRGPNISRQNSRSILLLDIAAHGCGNDAQFTHKLGELLRE